MKTIAKWAVNILVTILFILVVLSGYSMIQTRNNPGQIPSVMGYSAMSILSGSMSPMLEPGDMIVINKTQPEDIKVGEVITYRVGGNTFVTHRVIEILTTGNQISFQTQGDANNTSDQTLITPESMVGAFVLRIPKGGYIANFTRSPLGFILLIILPFALLIGNELKTILSKEKKEKNIKTS